MLGEVPTREVVVTAEHAATNAVMAGCRPEYMPTVVAALRAHLHEMANCHSTTGTLSGAAQALIINGPVRERIGMNSGINAMGGWNRANATIGRALRLVSGLTGQGRPGTLDRSALGQPGKISFCFAENEEASPWEPLSVTRGFEPGVSTVTVFSGDAPFSVSDHYNRDPEAVAKTILRVAREDRREAYVTFGDAVAVMIKGIALVVQRGEKSAAANSTTQES